MNDRPKVSVIIPVYNVEKYLRECLDSVLGQTLRDIEVICVDDGSTDSSLDILREYRAADNRVSIYTQKNRGAGAARNTGMQYATGEYLFFMDSDDYCSYDIFINTVECAEETGADIVAFDYYRFNDGESEKEYRCGIIKGRCDLEKETFSYKDVPQDICLSVNPMPWNKLFKSSFVKKSNIRWLETETTNDITFCTLASLNAERIKYIEKAFMYYRIRKNSSVTSKKRYNQDNVIKAVLAVDENASGLEHYNVIKNSIREFIFLNLFNSSKTYTPDPESANYIEFKNKIDAVAFSYPLFTECDGDFCRDESMNRKFAECRNRARRKQDFSFSPEIIVSMTSYPKRINTVYKSLASLFSQSLLPGKIILWLAEDEFPGREEDLPVELLDYKKLGLELRWCKENLKPHKKYFYAMQEFPNALIITVDDDLIYDETMIETLFVSYLSFPHAVSTMRTHLILPDSDNDITDYSFWQQEFTGIIGVPSMQLFSTSGAGTLYPPGCMDMEVFNVESIQTLCLNADDLWLKVMQVRKGTPVVLAQKYKRIKYIEGTQTETLCEKNVYQNENTQQLRSILSNYSDGNDFTDIVMSDNFDRTVEIVNDELINNNKFGLLNAGNIDTRYVLELEKEVSYLQEQSAKYKKNSDELSAKTKEQAKELFERYNTITELNKLKAERYNIIQELNKDKAEKYKKIQEQNARIVQLNKNIQEQNMNFRLLQNEKKELEKKWAAKEHMYTEELKDVYNSVSYRLGRFFTAVPRKIRDYLKKFR